MHGGRRIAKRTFLGLLCLGRAACLGVLADEVPAETIAEGEDLGRLRKGMIRTEAYDYLGKPDMSVGAGHTRVAYSLSDGPGQTPRWLILTFDQRVGEPGYYTAKLLAWKIVPPKLATPPDQSPCKRRGFVKAYRAGYEHGLRGEMGVDLDLANTPADMKTAASKGFYTGQYEAFLERMGFERGKLIAHRTASRIARADARMRDAELAEQLLEVGSPRRVVACGDRGWLVTYYHMRPGEGASTMTFEELNKRACPVVVADDGTRVSSDPKVVGKYLPDPEVRNREPVAVRLHLDGRKFELGEDVSCTLRIFSRFPKAFPVPDISLVSGKSTPQGLVRCLQHRVLKIAVKHNGQPVEAEDVANRPPAEDEPLPTVQLQPVSLIEATFGLCNATYPRFFAVDRPGKYEVSAVLDTTKSSDQQLWKGRVSTSPVSFTVTEVPRFRTKGPDETDAAYARAKVEFYLARIVGDKGVYARNVIEILRAKDGVPALIATLDSQNKEGVGTAKEILRRIYAPLDRNHEQRVFPKSKQAWMQWWRAHGAKRSFKELWHTFDSHWQ